VISGLVMALVASCTGDNKSATPTTTTTAKAVVPAPATTTTAPAAIPKFNFGFIAPGAPLLLDLAYAQENALSLAIADINAGGGVLGAPVAAATMDDRTAGSVANAVTALVKGGANALLGPVGSTDAQTAIPVIAGAGSLTCSASATLTDLNTSPPVAAFYRTALPDSETVEFVARQVEAKRDAVAAGQPWKVTIVARGDDYGTSVSSGLSALLASQGITTSVVTYHPEQTSLAQPAADVVATAPNAVVAVTYEEAPRLLDQLVNQGIPAASIIGLDAMFVPRLAEMTFPGAPQKLDGMTVIGVTGDRAFLQRLSALPSGQVQYGAQLYDCAMVIALAAQTARSTDPAQYGPKLNTVLTGARPCSTYADCRAKLDAGESIAYQGQIGTFRFNATNTPTASRFTVANLANGNFVVAQSVDVDFAAIEAAHAADLALAAAVQTTRIQQALTALGLYSGPIDGQQSDALTAAITALQQQLGLPATGVYDAETDAALRQKLGNAGTAVNEATASLQRALRDLGFYDGPIDGTYSAATIAGVRAFQASVGVPQTGIVDAATLRAIFDLGAASVPPPEPTTAPPTTEPPTTAPPVTKPPTTKPPTTEPPTTPAPTAAPTTAAPTTAPPETAAPTTAPTTPPTTAPPAPSDDIVATLSGDPRFSTYVGLLHDAGLADALALLGPVTVFAPTNDAFAALPPGVLDDARSDPAKLRDLLMAGMVEGRVTAGDLTSGATLTTLSETTLTVGGSSGSVTVGGAPVVPPELDASNGIIHPTSAVLRPGQ
jgi:branched-chain amino acid transport system substrate-binding protein